MENLDLFSDYFSDEVGSSNDKNVINEDAAVVEEDIMKKKTDDIDFDTRKDMDECSKCAPEDTFENKNDLKLIKIKQLCLRTDISAMIKVAQILDIIDPKPVKNEETSENNRETVKRSIDQAVVGDKVNTNKKLKTDEGVEEVVEDEDNVVPDTCVVCGLALRVFNDDKRREVHHYISHGFRVLKEFEVLKPDDSLFLMCNICNRYTIQSSKFQRLFEKLFQCLPEEVSWKL